MIPHLQTQFGKGNGDCFRTCVEAVLELPLASSPNFCGWDEETWFQSTVVWLKHNTRTEDLWRVAHQDGEIYYQSALDLINGIGMKEWEGQQNCLVLQDVMTPRGLKHSVVSRVVIKKGFFKINKIHDPHPDGGATWPEHEDMDVFYAVVAEGLWRP